MQRTLAASLIASQLGACAGSTGGSATPAGYGPARRTTVVRYRLPLRDNPLSPEQALHCYSGCQSKPTPAEYLHCLEACPGFETTPGVACLPEEVPPVAACFTAREAVPSAEQESDGVVIATVAGVVLVVALASVCASSHAQCYAAGLPPPALH